MLSIKCNDGISIDLYMFYDAKKYTSISILLKHFTKNKR